MVPDNPTVNLCIATAYLQHACSRSVGDRHSCILKAMAFFCRHAKHAGSRVEAAYNMGRALHHLELNSLAASWYERALVLGAGLPSHRSLAFEAGHNLALIYEGSGAHVLARRARQLHCRVC